MKFLLDLFSFLPLAKQNKSHSQFYLPPLLCKQKQPWVVVVVAVVVGRDVDVVTLTVKFIALHSFPCLLMHDEIKPYRKC